MNLAYPYRFDGRGRTAEADDAAHLRDLIEQLLFTAPGERLNRPGFGCGLGRLVFEPLSEELAMSAQFIVQAALTEWLGSRIEVSEVSIDVADAKLGVTVGYRVRRTGEARTESFSAPGGVT
ncbi:GPW/gp25 family protein [Niveibacterium terrae]|uniref:GPW/gp25 family protein n=1 Tax=Niveibacterium terrae TaxID=3373598 RepID=UPI003A8F8691